MLGYLCKTWENPWHSQTWHSPQRKHRSPNHCQLKCWHTQVQLNPCSRDFQNERKPCEPTLANWSSMREDSSLIFTSIYFMFPLVGNLHLYRLFQTPGSKSSKMILLVYMYRTLLCISSWLMYINKT